MTLGILRWHIENVSRKSHDSRNTTLVYLSLGAVTSSLFLKKGIGRLEGTPRATPTFISLPFTTI